MTASTDSTATTREPEAPSEGGVAAVDRAFAILSAFDADRPNLPLAEISRRTGLYKSTILRLMASLERGGYIRRLPDGQFSIGHEPLRLAQLYQGAFNVRDALYPILESLSQQCGETSSFYVAEGDTRVVLLRVEPKRSVRVAIHEGDRFPIAAGASGKILRAFGASHEPSLDQVRARFWAESYGERDRETSAISAPVFGHDGELLGALTISGPSQRFDAERIAAVRDDLVQKAAEASAALGCPSKRFAAIVKDCARR